MAKSSALNVALAHMGYKALGKTMPGLGLKDQRLSR